MLYEDREEDLNSSPKVVTRPGSTVELEVHEVSLDALSGNYRSRRRVDWIATEEPLEIRLRSLNDADNFAAQSVSVTMRTPGNDFELAAGFLFTEGIIRAKKEIAEITYCIDTKSAPQNYNIVRVTTSTDVAFDPQKLSRNVYTTSSCGVCGKTSIDLIRTSCSQIQPTGDFSVESSALLRLPMKVRESQRLFSRTGGIHAAALFDPRGTLLGLREDVGRHNALDKLVGSLLLKGGLPARDTILLVSGRASFELVQKAVMAGIPFVAAVGAPSSLAVELAREFGMTLVGFLRDSKFNLYSGEARVAVP